MGRVVRRCGKIVLGPNPCLIEFVLYLSGFI